MNLRACPAAGASTRPDQALSLRLRQDTQALHQAVERQLGLPGTIASRQDYVACLRRFHALYNPLGQRFQAFPDWPDHGFRLAEHDHAPRLAADLACLEPGADLPPDAPGHACPDLPSFADALGALYVLEGSRLGGTVILRHLVEAGVDGAASACTFLGGTPGAPSSPWRTFRAALDRYGTEHPHEIPAVITGAERTFRAVGTWMAHNQWSRA